MLAVGLIASAFVWSACGALCDAAGSCVVPTASHSLLQKRRLVKSVDIGPDFDYDADSEVAAEAGARNDQGWQLRSASDVSLATSTRSNESNAIEPIHYLHIPKTGTSFQNTLVHHFCGDVIPTDYSIPNGAPSFKSAWGSACRDNWYSSFQGGHHPLGVDAPVEHVVTMIRNPLQRIVSGYYHGLHGCTPLQRKYHCERNMSNPDPKSHSDFLCDGDSGSSFGSYLRNTSIIPPIEYGECAKNCYANMLTGYPCEDTEGSQNSPADVELAVARIGSLGFVGITDEWARSVCLWHAKFGGRCLPVELANVRPGVVDVTANDQGYDVSSLLGDWRPQGDMRIWQAALDRFWSEVHAYNVTDESCQACFSEV